MLAADELDELAPQLAPPARRLEPEWVARYTVLVPDRGIVAKQG